MKNIKPMNELPKNSNLMKNIRSICRKAIEEKGLTEAEVRKSLGIGRYEK